jgi:hypothetical protein
VSWLSLVIAVGSALGGGGVLAGLIHLVVLLVRERRLSRVTAQCLTAKSKADREHALRVLELIQQPSDQDLGIELKPEAPSR